MLGRLRAQLETELRSRGVPVRVEYGPAVPGRTSSPVDVVVVSYDPSGDAFGALARGARVRMTRTVRMVAEVRAHANVAGARRQDHEDRAQRIVDSVLLSLDQALRGAGYIWRSTGGRFVADAERLPEGALYELAFEAERSVRDQDWAESDPEAFELEAGSIASRTSVFGSLGEGAGETACGGE